MNNAGKKTIGIVMLLAAALICGQGLFANGAPEKGIGETVTVEFGNEYFDSLAISGIEDFEVVLSDNYAVTVKADESIIEEVEVIQRGASLSISLDDAYKYNPSVLEAVVEVPCLDELEIDGKSHGILSGTPVPCDMEISLTDSSSLELENLLADKAIIDVSVDSTLTGKIDTDNLTMKVYSSDVDVTGSTKTLYCFADDDSEINMSSLYITDTLLDFHDETEGAISFRDYDGKTSHTIVKLYDETDISLSTEGELNDDETGDDAELN